MRLPNQGAGLILCGFCLETLTGAVFLSSGAGPFFWAAHAAGTAAFLAALRFSFHNVRRTPLHPVLLQGFLLAAFFPFWGCWTALLFYLGIRFFESKPSSSDLLEDYQESLRPEKLRLEFTSSPGETMRRFRAELNFESFVDVLQSGTKEKTKAGVIEKLSKNLTPENVSLLHLALRDASAEVRMYAAGALIQLEADLNRRILESKKNARKKGTASAWSETGEIYQRYAESGLLDETLARYYRGLAVNAYRNSLDSNTNQPEIVAHYLRCLYALEDFKRAGAVMNHALETWPQDKQLLMLGAEFDFQMHQYEACRKKLARVDPASLDTHEKEVHSFWLEAL